MVMALGWAADQRRLGNCPGVGYGGRLHAASIGAGDETDKIRFVDGAGQAPIGSLEAPYR
ncbi:MAG: hypothetical protein QOJ73_3806 [Streptosporangiaceae bacterium]|jgi:hypothetical protein|nr:hypothetical protein [Streptosporangiaceae bacterium]